MLFIYKCIKPIIKAAIRIIELDPGSASGDQSSRIVQGPIAEYNGYKLYSVIRDSRIDHFVESLGHAYRRGCGYYQWTKPEIIRPGRVILTTSGAKNFEAHPVAPGSMVHREINYSTTVKTDPPYYNSMYVQSTSNTRVLKAGTKFIYDTGRRTVNASN